MVFSFLQCRAELQLVSVYKPLHDALVRADDGGLNVDGMVPHPSQLHGLLQSSNHEERVVPLCAQRGKRSQFCSCSGVTGRTLTNPHLRGHP